MKIEIDIDEYFTQEMIKEIAEDELRKAFRRQFQKESDVERVIANLSSEFVFTLIAEQWDGDFTELLRKKIKGAIEDDTIKYIVFRRKDAWDRTESPAVAILDEECANARPLIREHKRIPVPRIRQERNRRCHLRCDYGSDSFATKGGTVMTREESIALLNEWNREKQS